MKPDWPQGNPIKEAGGFPECSLLCFLTFPSGRESLASGLCPVITGAQEQFLVAISLPASPWGPLEPTPLPKIPRRQASHPSLLNPCDGCCRPSSHGRASSTELATPVLPAASGLLQAGNGDDSPCNCVNESETPCVGLIP